MKIPVNGHLVIEPLVHEGFMASQSDSYEEIGIVKILPLALEMLEPKEVSVGDKVFFDSWLAAKYPVEGGKLGEFLWLVKWEDVRLVETPDAVPPVSE